MTTASGSGTRPLRGDLLDLTIEKVIFGGDGLARLEGGFVVFVPFTAPGDRARVRITDCKSQHARAEIVELLQPAAARATPPCPYYGRCGGCQYQHLTDAVQLRLKEEQVREAFARVGKLADAPILPILASPKSYGYRNRITVHAGEGRVGFRGTDRRTLVDISACLLARDGVNAQLTALRQRRPSEGHFSLRDDTIPPSGFHQANHELAAELQRLVAGSMPDRGKLLIEAYCGGGFFTAGIAARFDRVIAIDNDPRTLRDAHRLALPGVEWREADAAFALPDALREVPTGARAETTVLVDPPREGLPVRVSEALGLEPVAHLTYVSCNPATLARDARLLAKSYRLVSVQPIDLFPQTAQIECVCVWQR